MDAILRFPNSGYTYRPLKKFCMGQDVAALQLNLGMPVDGVYGSATVAAVSDYQRAHGLVSDGIAGIRTQKSLGLTSANGPQAQYGTPGGLLRGIIEGESGWLVGAVSGVHSDGSRDVGWVQRNLSAGQQQNAAIVAAAFDGKAAIGNLALTLRQRHDANLGQPGAKTHDLAWRYAVLAHNWPAAAEHFVDGSIDTWVYRAKDRNGVTQSYRMRDSADWITAIGVKDVSTGYEWATFYVNTKVKYVRSYSESKESPMPATSLHPKVAATVTVATLVTAIVAVAGLVDITITPVVAAALTTVLSFISGYLKKA